LTAVLACVVLLPWAKIRAAEVRAEKLENIYSSGLSPCGASDDDFEALVQRYQPEKATLEIREFPTLKNEAYVVQIIGQRVYSLEFKPLYGEGRRAPRGLNTDIAPKISVAYISPETGQELGALLAEDIRNAQSRRHLAIDGVGYIFNEPGVGCASTHSPPASSRADKLTDLYYSLLRHVTLTNASAIQKSDHAILVATRALRVD